MLQEPLQRHLAKVQLLHEEDLQEGYGDVYLPYAFERKDVRTRTESRRGIFEGQRGSPLTSPKVDQGPEPA